MDRFSKGLVAGVCGGLLMNIWGFLIKDLFRISTRNYVDWAAVVIYGFLPQNWYQFLFALVSHLLWAGFLGTLFAFLLPSLTYRRSWLKGGLFGFIIGFFIYGVAIIMRMPFFTKIPFHTSIGNAFGGLLWGIVTAEIIKWLDNKYVDE